MTHDEWGKWVVRSNMQKTRQEHEDRVGEPRQYWCRRVSKEDVAKLLVEVGKAKAMIGAETLSRDLPVRCMLSVIQLQSALMLVRLRKGGKQNPCTAKKP